MIRRLLPLIIVPALALAACGGSDDEAGATVPATTPESTAAAATSTADAPATTASPTTDTSTVPVTTQADESSVEETSTEILVNDISEMPEECVDLMADFLVLIEPVVAEIDWNTASLNDFQAISDQLDSQFAELDTKEAAAGCDQYDFADNADSLAAVLELAEEKAPGTTGWLNFLGALTTEASTDVAGAPTTCDEAIAYVESVIAETPSMGDLALADMSALGQAMTLISTDCEPQQAAGFFSRDDVTSFTSG